MLKTCPDCNGDGAIGKDTDNEREQATAFIRWREIVACDMVKAHWPRIQLVAGQLLERENLSHTDLDAIIVPRAGVIWVT